MFLADKGYNPDYGARPLRRVVQEHVEDALSEGLLAGRFQEGDVIEVDFDKEKGELTFTVKERSAPTPDASQQSMEEFPALLS